ncbi:hypothetical protein BU26DRAFT_297414 [Trematosphaeria pertusa]|uniref:Uncharacterized protein n=1 Tax=Trematosphaeria pertusa TaxID=390896 RepID=A0A6A6IK26_9PLEO|nr:uncharacterized protein BU26DRAFT_297414 [Trematosphaeria pertusa]KAF2250232.1 hypothetical protein BU26DRAFT_297414 [Trematosphaeria pertusa]
MVRTRASCIAARHRMAKLARLTRALPYATAAVARGAVQMRGARLETGILNPGRWARRRNARRDGLRATGRAPRNFARRG